MSGRGSRDGRNELRNWGYKEQMRPVLKMFLIIEVAVCFGPLILWWGMGLVMAALQIGMLFHDFAEVAPSALLVFALVGAGTVGLMALLEVLRSLFDPSASLMNPNITLLFVVIGLMPVIWMIYDAPWTPWILIGLVPMVATVHIIYLGRQYLFSSFRDPG